MSIFCDLHSSKISKAIMLANIDLSAILEEKTRELVKGLLNFIEQLSSSLREARAEIQKLRDENNRLKGEQGP